MQLQDPNGQDGQSAAEKKQKNVKFSSHMLFMKGYLVNISTCVFGY